MGTLTQVAKEESVQQAHLVTKAGGTRERHHGHQHFHELQAAPSAVLTAHGHQGPHAQQQVLPVSALRTEQGAPSARDRGPGANMRPRPPPATESVPRCGPWSPARHHKERVSKNKQLDTDWELNSC